MPIIKLENIRHSYKVGSGSLLVLKGIDLSIEQGEFVAIMGPSGSGKSTLLQILGLLERPSQGKYFLLGKDVSDLSDDEGASLRSKTIGFVFQMFNLLSRTSAVDNVLLPAIYSGNAVPISKAKELLADVGLQDREEHKPNQLSGGQQQRVAIARSLINSPKIIFADEPTGNLASDQAEEILRKLSELNARGITVIMVTHEPDIAAYAKRIIKIKDGAIQSDEKNLNPKGFVSEKSAVPPSLNGNDYSHLPPKLSLLEIKENSLSALRAISANKTRSFLSVLGILIGVCSVIAMLAIGRGAQKSIEARISGLGSNLIMIWPFSSSAFHGGTGSVSRLSIPDVEEISHLSSHIIAVNGEVSGSAQVVYKDKNTNTEVDGDMTSFAPMHSDEPYYGRFFTQEENDEVARVAVLGQTVVNNLFGNADPVGKRIKINRVSFEVIGILPPKGSSAWHDQDDVIVIPLKTAMMRLGLNGWGGSIGHGGRYLNRMEVECDTPQSIDGVMSKIKTFLRTRHHLPAYKDDDFTVRNMQDIQSALTGTTKTFGILLGIVAAISILVGGIGIMNIMLVSVTERTREIGLRKAVGAPRRAILTQFLIESAFLSLLGGTIGVLLGIGISFMMTHYAGWSAIVTPQSILLAFGCSAMIGIVFGFWPARKASLLSPIEALRYE